MKHLSVYIPNIRVCMQVSGMCLCQSPHTINVYSSHLRVCQSSPPRPKPGTSGYRPKQTVCGCMPQG